MPHEVFVSYANRDRIPADAVVAHLERQGVACWIAPRNISPGASWPKAIVEAIKASRVMVLVFSSHSNDSEHVRREVELAIKRGITVIPLRIEDCVPQGELEFFLSSAHWMDAITPPLEHHLQQFGTRVKTTLDGSGDSASVPATTHLPASRLGVKDWRSRMPILVTSAAALMICVGLLAVLGRGGTPRGSTGGTLAADSDASRIDPQTIAEMDEYARERNAGRGEAYLARLGPMRHRTWETAAEAGYAPAQYAVGMLYWHGIGFAQDFEAAVEWITRAADQNYPPALSAIGYACDLGVGGLRQDRDAYISYTMASAELGDVGGMRNLAWTYREGYGTLPQDSQKALEWYGRAAEAGYPAAMWGIALIYKNGYGSVAPDPDLARSWTRRAADAGNPYAQASLFGDPFVQSLGTYAETLSADSETGPQAARTAQGEIESLVVEYDHLQFEAQLSIMGNWRATNAMIAIGEADEDDPIRVILEQMTNRLIDQFQSSHKVVRQRLFVSFASATVRTLEKWQDQGEWQRVTEFWDESYADLDIGYDPPKDIEPLVRQLRICTLGLYNQGRREHAGELVDLVLAIQAEHLEDRPWDWYAEESYTSFGFKVAETASLLGDDQRAQALLNRSWSLLFGRYGQESFVGEHRGRLPLRNTIPAEMPDEDKARFLQFADEEMREQFESSSTAAIPKGTMKRFTLPVDFGSVTAPFDVYVMDGPRGFLELQDQFRWLAEYRGGVVPQAVQDSFQRLYSLALKHDVSYPELCVYAIGEANKQNANSDMAEIMAD